MTSLHSHRGAMLVSALIAGGVLTGAVACTDTALPTTPDAAPILLVVSDDVASAFQAAVQDARDRVLPGVSTDAGRRAIGPALEALGASVAARNARALRSAVAEAEAVLAAPTARDAADQAELAAVQLVIEHARALAAGDATRTP